MLMVDLVVVRARMAEWGEGIQASYCRLQATIGLCCVHAILKGERSQKSITG